MSSDAELFRALRRTWETVDPEPVDLVDRMVAAVAAADLSDEYALLTLVADAETAAVRGDAEMLTLQFSDGTTSVLLHVSATESGRRRIDGWVDGAALSIELEQDAGSWTTASDGGRFAFDDVPPGMSRLRVMMDKTVDGGSAELRTPRFEV
jgi:hypothetical protein